MKITTIEKRIIESVVIEIPIDDALEFIKCERNALTTTDDMWPAGADRLTDLRLFCKRLAAQMREVIGHES